MGQREQLAPGEFYHIYNRGVEKRDIFLDHPDKKRFLALLYICNSENPVHIQIQGRTLNKILKVERGKRLVDICAYCLMPNHYHLLLRESNVGGISKFMQKISTGYSMYFNKRYERTGTLFQGKFKSTHATHDQYLKYLISYIHLNPIKLIESKWKQTGISNRSRAKTYLERYAYSSYLDFIGTNRPEEKILTPSALPEYFETLSTFEAEINEWLSYSNGSEDFKVES